MSYHTPVKRVGVIGLGAVGGVVAKSLAMGDVPGCVLAGTFTSTGRGTVDSISQLLDRCDVIVEAASQRALKAYCVAVAQKGIDLIAVSVGAFTDSAFVSTLEEAKPGRLLVCTGAIGGVDVLRSAAMAGSLESVTLTTSKAWPALMYSSHACERLSGRTPLANSMTVFDGNAGGAARVFPKTANVAATVALAGIGFEDTRVRVVALPAESKSSHELAFRGRAGNYRFSLQNSPSESNPRTSGITPFSVLRALQDLSSSLVIGA